MRWTAPSCCHRSPATTPPAVTAAADLPIPAEARADLDSGRVNLAGTEPPSGLDAALRVDLARAIDEAFVDGFRLAMITAAALALLSAVIAALSIERRRAD